MGIFNPQNPASDDGYADRLDDIKAQYAGGSITKTQYDELMATEAVTASFLRLKYAGLAVLLGTVGFFLLWANL